jgi:hypothetical protein
METFKIFKKKSFLFLQQFVLLTLENENRYDDDEDDDDSISLVFLGIKKIIINKKIVKRINSMRK